MAKFKKNLAKKSSPEQVDKDYATACFLIEKKLGCEITPDYPAAKFVVQMEEIKNYYEKQEREMNKGKGRSTLR